MFSNSVCAFFFNCFRSIVSGVAVKIHNPFFAVSTKRGGLYLTHKSKQFSWEKQKKKME